MAKKNYDDDNQMLEKSQLEILLEKRAYKKACKEAKKKGLPMPPDPSATPEESTAEENANFDESQFYEDENENQNEEGYEEEYYEEDTSYDDNEDEYENIDIGGFGRYPRIYLDPSDTFINDDGDPEIYFNLEKTLVHNHLGWLFNLIPYEKREKILDKVWNMEFLHDYANIQHAHAEKLNSLTPGQQRMHDLKVLGAKILIILAIVTGFYCNYRFVVLPQNIYNQSLSNITQKHYDLAKDGMDSLKGKWDSAIYSTYCDAHIKLNENSFDEAKEIFKSLVQYQSSCSYLEDLTELQKECDYKKGIYYYEKKDWIQAMDILGPIIKYSNAFDYYQSCLYQIALEKVEQGLTFDAIDQFDAISSFKDSGEQRDLLLSSIYNEAMKKYDKKDYLEASAIFQTIVKYNYLDSQDKCIQCFYRYAQDLFAERQYSDAQQLFSQIPHYKDSLTMVKECEYQILKNMDFSTENILNILSLEGYRDTDSILESQPYNLYGEWEIKEMQSADGKNRLGMGYTFKFNERNCFVCDIANLPNVAIQPGYEYPYLWKDDHFETNDKQYYLYIDSWRIASSGTRKYPEIKIRCVNAAGEETFYICEKIGSILNFEDNTLIVNLEETNDFDLIALYLKEKEIEANSQENNPDENTNPDTPITEQQPSDIDTPNPNETTNPDPLGQPQEELLRSTFQGTVLRIDETGTSFIVKPDEYSEEQNISTRFSVSYPYSTDLYENDVVEITYMLETRDMEESPVKIVAESVQIISSPYTTAATEQALKEAKDAATQEVSTACGTILSTEMQNLVNAAITSINASTDIDTINALKADALSKIATQKAIDEKAAAAAQSTPPTLRIVSIDKEITVNTQIPISLAVGDVNVGETINVYYSINTGEDKLLCTLQAIGEEQLLEFNFPAFTQAGKYNLTFKAIDSNGRRSNEESGDVSINYTTIGNQVTINVKDAE